MLRKVLVIKPGHEEAAKKLVELYTKAERKDKLGVFLRDYVDQFPDRVWAMVSYVKLLSSIGNIKAAEGALAHATADDHVSPDLYLLYAKALDTQKRYDDAKNILSEGAEHFPKDGRIRFDLALIYDHAGTTKLAEQAYNAVQISDPELYYQAQVNLALMYERNGNLQRALGTLAVLDEKFGKNELLTEKIEDLKMKVHGPGVKTRSIANEEEKK